MATSTSLLQENENTMNLLNFFMHLGQAKRTYRSGWILRGINEAESIADHMYRMAMMSFLAPEGLDRNKCIQMCLIHDLAECIVGDLTPEDGVNKEDKAHRERSAMLSLTSMLNKDVGNNIWNLYSEYEQHKSDEANYVKSLDLFDMYLQAYEYELLTGNNLSEFYSNTSKLLSDEDNGDNKFSKQVKQWLNKLIDIRNNKIDLLPNDSNLNTILKHYLKKNNKN